VKRIINFLILFFITSVLALVVVRISQNKKESYIPRASSRVPSDLGRMPVSSSQELLPLALRINSPERPDYKIILQNPSWLINDNLIDIREPDYRLHLFAFYKQYLAENNLKGLLLTDMGECPEPLEDTSCPSWWNMSQKELVAELRQQLTDPVIYFRALPIDDTNWELNRHYFLSLDGVVVEEVELEAFKSGIADLVSDEVLLRKTILPL